MPIAIALGLALLLLGYFSVRGALFLTAIAVNIWYMRSTIVLSLLMSTMRVRRYMATSHSVQFAGGNLSGQRHICAFFNITDEEHTVLRSFIKDGFDRGDKAFHLVDAQLREEHLKRLAEAGTNVQETMDTGQLAVLPG